MLERVFAAYMFAGAVPLWARHYTREILRELRSDAPDLARFGFERPRRSARRATAGSSWPRPWSSSRSFAR